MDTKNPQHACGAPGASSELVTHEEASSTAFQLTPATVLAFPPRPRRLRADVPPFDPSNPAHLAAWESMFDFGRAELARQEGR